MQTVVLFRGQSLRAFAVDHNTAYGINRDGSGLLSELSEPLNFSPCAGEAALWSFGIGAFIVEDARRYQHQPGFTEAVHESIRGVYTELMNAEKQSRIQEWIGVKQENAWLRRSFGEDLQADRFFPSVSIRELSDLLSRRPWRVGDSVYLDDMCFVKLTTCAGTWMAIKEGTAFDTINTEKLSVGMLRRVLCAIQTSTVKECRDLQYMANLPARRASDKQRAAS